MLGEQALQAELGRRLRRARERAGWTVTAAAQRSGLSRRLLTDLEAGRANPTVLTLARLARCLATPLGELCDLVLAPRTERVALVGLRGAGKSTVGPRLALALDAPFVELDERVELAAGMRLAEIFDLRGEPTYRRLERETLEEVLAEGGRSVVAAGGSIVQAPETFARLREACRTVWLRARPEEHLARVLAQGDRRPTEGRPRAMEELRAILEERGPAYRQCELTVDTSDRSVEDVVALIRRGLQSTDRRPSRSSAGPGTGAL